MPLASVAQLLTASAASSPRLRDQRRDGRGIGLQARLGQPERERSADEVLLRAVVQVALDAAALGVAGGDDARPRLVELEPGVDIGDRLADELGERAETSLGAAWERHAHGCRPDGAPEPPVHHDRRGDGRSHPLPAQLGGVRALHALEAVQPAGSGGALDLRERHLTHDLDLLAHGEAAGAGPVPLGQDGRQAGGVVAGDEGRIGVEVARDLAGHERQHLLGGVLPRDGGRDPAQRALLLEPRAQGELEALVRKGEAGDRKQVAVQVARRVEQQRRHAPAPVRDHRDPRRRRIDVDEPAVGTHPAIVVGQPVGDAELRPVEHGGQAAARIAVAGREQRRENVDALVHLDMILPSRGST